MAEVFAPVLACQLYIGCLSAPNSVFWAVCWKWIWAFKYLSFASWHWIFVSRRCWSDTRQKDFTSWFLQRTCVPVWLPPSPVFCSTCEFPSAQLLLHEDFFPVSYPWSTWWHNGQVSLVPLSGSLIVVCTPESRLLVRSVYTIPQTFLPSCEPWPCPLQ